MCEECEKADCWWESPIIHCDMCDVGVRVEQVGEYWRSLPAGWFTSTGRDYDDREIFVCCKEHATEYDQAIAFHEELSKRWAGISSTKQIILKMCEVREELEKEYGENWKKKLHRADLKNFLLHTKPENLVEAIMEM